jgi:hypothetical protein
MRRFFFYASDLTPQHCVDGKSKAPSDETDALFKLALEQSLFVRLPATSARKVTEERQGSPLRLELLHYRRIPFSGAWLTSTAPLDVSRMTFTVPAYSGEPE